MRPFLEIAALCAAIALPQHAFGQDKATNPGRAVVTVGIEVVEVAGNCDFGGFGFFEPDGAYVSFVSVILSRDRDGQVTGVRDSRISLGGEDWEILQNGPIAEDELSFSFEAQVRDLSLIQGDRLPAHVAVTCAQPHYDPERQADDGPEGPEVQN